MSLPPTTGRNVTGELPDPWVRSLPVGTPPVPAGSPARPDTRAGVPISELVLVDQHEAQGWRVRHDERLDNIFEQRCDWIREYGRAGQLAVDTDELSLTYDELDQRANQLARYLRLHGADAGDRIALLFDSPVQAYVGLLAVLKISATCVPLDVDSPTERIAYVVADARVRMVLTQSHLRGRVAGIESLRSSGAELLFLDEAARLIAEMSRQRLAPAERGSHADQLAYISYTIGPSGWPVGVAIDHRSICNFVRVAAATYGIRAHRLYQGQAPATAGAVEEIWVAWAAGATLVPAPAGPRLRGRGLHAFLSAKRVTALCTTPTLLATVEDDLPDLRLLLLAGEACPQSLVARWSRRGRRFLNAYGPAGAAVTATWTEVHPDKPVTVGVPLPTYATVVLDPDVPRRALRHGETGEIGVAGIGLSCGYLDGNHLTDNAFVEDFLGIPGNPSGRIYRTGDLGRVNDAGELEYRGRIDEQIYIGGERVDLTEVESVLLAVPGIAAAVVATHRPAPGVTELVGYYTLRADTPRLDQQVVLGWLRERLAPHNVPAHLELLDAIPMTVGDRADRRALPAPGTVVRPAARAASPAELERLRAENAGLLEQLHRMQPPPRPVEAPTQRIPAVTAQSTAGVTDLTETVQFAPAPVQPATSPAEAGLAQVLAEVLDVERVPVDSNFFDDLGADSMVMARFCARLRKRSDLPNVSIKDIYANPTIRGIATALAPAPAAPAAPAPAVAAPAGPDPLAMGLAQVLGEVLDMERVQVESNFFDDLGADSMVMARFCARLRKRSDLPNISIKDVYANPTIAALAAAFAPAAPAVPQPAAGQPAAGQPAAPAPAPDPATELIPVPVAPYTRASTLQYLFCGLLQLLLFIAYAVGAGTVIDLAFQWISSATDLLDIYVRSVVAGAGAFAAMCTLPIVVKWLLIGRFKPRQIRIWSLGYVRFWLVKILIRSNPLALMSGTPLFNLYLRALGAKVGRNVAIFNKQVPVCADLISIGEGTVIRKEVVLSGYRAHGGLIQTGPVTIGRDVVVGEKSIFDIWTSMGDGAQLGHASSLHAGQHVPTGQRWHGSPAEPTNVDYRAIGPAPVGALRKTVFSLVQLAKLLGVLLPLAFGGLSLLLAEIPSLRALLEPGPVALGSATMYLDALLGSAAIVFGGLLVGLLIVTTVPRLLNLAITPGKVYRLYGFHYSLHRTITRMTNVKLFVLLLGDSSFIVGYLRGIGYDLGKVEQTGSNFGSAVAHETPFLVSVGTGTVVADGLSVANADYSATSFRVTRATIGAHNFLGNHIAYPSEGRTGDNCLLATKVAIPIDGAIREGVGLLGSPAFEIPRSVQRDLVLDSAGQDDLRPKLRRKNRHNLVTLAMALVVRWVHVFGLLVLAMAAVDVYREFGIFAFAAEIIASLVFTLVYFVFVERLGGGFRRRRPEACSIYDPIFWRHERYWKLVLPQVDKALAGTPYKNLLTRALGTRLGKRVFDNGTAQTERTLVTIGDDATLNEGSVIQCHSQEDGAFKSDHTALGAGVTLGVGALVHYGVTIGDGAVIAPDTFLMKGEEVLPYERWGGNPAREMPELARPVVRRQHDIHGAPLGAPAMPIRNGEIRHDVAGTRFAPTVQYPGVVRR